MNNGFENLAKYFFLHLSSLNKSEKNSEFSYEYFRISKIKEMLTILIANYKQ